MKKLLLLLVCIPSLMLSAQVKTKKADILWGKEYDAKRLSTLKDIVGYDESGFYAVRKTGFRGTNIEHYGQDMNLITSEEVELDQQNQDLNLEMMIHLNGKLLMFTSFANKKTAKNYLFYQEINKKTLKVSSELKKIVEIDISEGSVRNSGEFGFSLSRDSSKLLIFNTLPFNKSEDKSFGYSVFDANMNLIWQKNVTLPYEDKLFDDIDFQTDNEGNVYLLGRVYREKRKSSRRGEVNYRFEIHSYHNKGEEFRLYPVELKGLFLTDMQIAINDKNEIICAGFYSEVGTFSIVGSYFLKLNGETKELIHQSTSEFGLDFITQNLTDREEAKAKRKASKGKDVELFEYDLDEIVLRDDGGAVLVGEQFFIRIVTNTTFSANGGTSTSSTTYYYYNDIIVVNVNPAGEIEWTEKIGKRQRTAEDGGFYSSYALSVVKDKMYFVFNDDPMNLHYKGEGKMKNFVGAKSALVVLVTLDSEGKQQREALFSNREADIICRPKVCEQISDNEMIIFGQRKKTQRFAKLSFK